MNKRDLIIAASAKSGITQRELKKCFEPIIESILEGLSKGEHIAIANFGTFYIKAYKERNSVDPRSNTPIIVKAKKIVKFKLSPSVIINQEPLPNNIP